MFSSPSAYKSVQNSHITVRKYKEGLASRCIKNNDLKGIILFFLTYQFYLHLPLLGKEDEEKKESTQQDLF